MPNTADELHFSPWFLEPKETAAETLVQNFDAVESCSQDRIDALNSYRNLYRDHGYAGIRPWSYRQSMGADPMPENMLRPLVDTLTAKLIRNRPRVTAATTGAGLEARQRARNLSLFWDGVWEQNRVHAQLGKYVRDGEVTGDGVWFVHREMNRARTRGRIRIELVSVSELFVDDVEAFDGQPQTLYRRRFVSRHWLMQQFKDSPAAVKAIKTTARAEVDDTTKVVGPLMDLIVLLESWHLPSILDGDDGRYLMAVGDTSLRDAPWPYPDFPFVRFSPSPPMSCDGYWGTGMVEQLISAQRNLTDTAQTVLKAQRVLGAPWLLEEQNSNIQTSHLQNVVGTVVRYKGTPPQLHTPHPGSRQMYQDVAIRRQRMVEDSGVSRMSLTSNKPTGFDPSGRAIQELSDVETERFLEQGRALEESMVQLAKWTVWLARELDQELEGGYKLVARDGKEALELKWSDVDLDDDAFIMHNETSAWQSRSVSGKIADVERLANSGAIQDPVVFARMLQIPDVDAYLDQQGSPSRVVEMMAEVMLTTGTFVPPEPYMDIQPALFQMQLIYLSEVAKRKGANDKRLGLLRRWLEKAAAMLEPPAQPVDPAAAGGAVPADPGLAPGTAAAHGVPAASPPAALPAPTAV